MKEYNDYSRLVDPRLYAAIPKAVFAAVAVSFVAACEDSAENTLTHPAFVNGRIVQEWTALWRSGVVSQQPPRWALALGALTERDNE